LHLKIVLKKLYSFVQRLAV